MRKKSEIDKLVCPGYCSRCWLSSEAVFGEQVNWYFAQIPNDAKPGEDFQRVVGDVDFPPEEALARGSHKMMMIVMPAFAEGKQR